MQSAISNRTSAILLLCLAFASLPLAAGAPQVVARGILTNAVVSVPGTLVPVWVDIDRDGRKDLVCGSEYGKVRVFRNTGSSGAPVFAAPVNLLLSDGGEVASNVYEGTYPEITDWNGDGLPDLLLGRSSSQSVHLFTNATAAAGVMPRFGYVGVLPALGGTTNIVYANDTRVFVKALSYDGTSSNDLLVGYNASGTGRLVWYKNIGTPGAPVLTNRGAIMDGTGAALSFWFSPNGRFFDWNSDGTNELLVGDIDSMRVYVPTNNPPQWTSVSYIGLSITSSYYCPVPVGDINGDGRPDLLVGEVCGGAFWATNTGGSATRFKGAYPVPGASQPIVFGGSTDFLSVWDMHGDGMQDLTMLRHGRSGYRACVNAGTSNLLALQTFVPKDWPTPMYDVQCVRAGTVAHMYVSTAGGVPLVYTNYAAVNAPEFNGLRAITNTQGGTPLTNVHTFAVADWDKDGLLDFIANINYTNYWYRNTNDNARPVYAPPVTLQADGKPLVSSSYATKPCPVDWDCDGDMDFMTCDNFGNFSYYENTNGVPPVLTFRGFVMLGTTNLDLGIVPEIATGDMDGNGRPSLYLGTGGMVYQFEVKGPALQWSPASLATNVATNTVASLALVVTNVGWLPLAAQLYVTNPWISAVAPTNFTLAGGDATSVVVSLSAWGFNPGITNRGPVFIVHNDPDQTSPTQVPIRMITYQNPYKGDRYVALNGGHLPPFSSWGTAATNIQAAVTAANAGERILLSNGTFFLAQQVTVTSKTVRGIAGPAATIVDGGGAVRGFYLVTGVVEGVTVQHCTPGLGAGGGIFAADGSVISNCIMQDNLSGLGGGVYLGVGSRISASICRRNSSTFASGGGIYATQAGWIDGVVVEACTGVYGGGVFCSYCTNGGMNACQLVGNVALDGGGGVYCSYGGTVRNCAIVGNAAAHDGGGALAHDTLFVGCTFYDNRANTGGGVRGDVGMVVHSSIVYGNTASTASNNYYGGEFEYTCAEPAPPGVSNFFANPGFMAAFNPHIPTNSPCIDMGNAADASGTDIDGEPRVFGTSVDTGCDEVYPDAITGALTATVSASVTNTVVGYPVSFVPDVRGKVLGTTLNLGDGTILTNTAGTTQTYAFAANYPVVLRAWNGSDSAAATVMVHVTGVLTNYVSTTGGDTPPYAIWAQAARRIQDAVDVCAPGGVVLVADGTYRDGGTPAYGVTNRVMIAKDIAVLSQNGPAGTIIEGAGPTGSNAVRGAYLSAGILAGFTISNGTTHAVGHASYNRGGGGVLLDQGGVLSNCLVIANTATNQGGGILCYYGGSVCRCTAAGNRANVGGGGHCEHGGTFDGCVFAGNQAVTGGGVRVYYGTVTNCTATGNRASVGGGAAIYGYTIPISLGVMLDSVVGGNTATNGGGVYGYYCAVDRCIVTGNTALVNGGGMYLSISVADRCTVSGNTAPNGGGVYNNGGEMYRSAVARNRGIAGGGIYAEHTYFDACTIVTNTAFVGGGVYAAGLSRAYNSVIAQNNADTAPNWIATTSDVQFVYCCTTPAVSNGFDQGGNIAADPMFVLGATGDFHLALGSPCINTGSNEEWMATTTDLDGNPRICEGTVDMGCYETVPEPAATAALFVMGCACRVFACRLPFAVRRRKQ